MSKKHFLRGTLILTCAGIISRLIGFFYRVFLSHSIGAQGVGIYQLIVPLQTLVLALTTSGVQTVISRLTASRTALGKEKEARDCLSVGTFAALSLSLILSVIIWRHAEFFAEQILKEPRTLSLIRLLSFSFPLSAIHNCINSYFFARKKTGIPSSIQLLEQAARVAVTYLLYLVILSEGRPVTPVIAVGGALSGEIVSVLVSLLVIGVDFRKNTYSPFKIPHPLKELHSIILLSFPLTLNRLLLTLLSSIEVVLIPQRLRAFGLDAGEALSVYGVFTGMALPVILFPATVTNSASVMLMPSIAELQALGYQKRIRYVTVRTCGSCILLGGLCALGFFFFGEPAGTLLFKSPTAGTYIRTMAFICPFLYMNTALSSILHGLGQAGVCLFNNALSVSIRIAFVLFCIPQIGIRGYLYGILASELVRTLLHLFSLFRLEKPAGKTTVQDSRDS
ncbi:MAG: polysaccharide biosynthesis protein [Eubacteriales bacterium]|nr:polysaccharide biosynthesis protein [Eubacteriales bacterium]